MFIRSYRVSNLLIWTCVASFLCWILSIWESLGCIFPNFGLIHALSTRGRLLWRKSASVCILKVFEWFRVIFGLLQFPGFPGGHWPDRWCPPVWLVWSVRTCAFVGHWSDRCCGPVWPIRGELVQLLCFVKWFACIHPRGVACVQGKLFVVFELWFGGLLLFAWSCFCLDCVELLPLPM
jgi:hypothetical protein